MKKIEPSDLMIFKNRMNGIVKDPNDFTEKMNIWLSDNLTLEVIHGNIIDYFDEVYGPHMFDAMSIHINQLATDIIKQLVIPILLRKKSK